VLDHVSRRLSVTLIHSTPYAAVSYVKEYTIGTRVIDNHYSRIHILYVGTDSNASHEKKHRRCPHSPHFYVKLNSMLGALLLDLVPVHIVVAEKGHLRQTSGFANHVEDLRAGGFRIYH
jgi:hypothetical protein